jgi:hypothetical protein
MSRIVAALAAFSMLALPLQGLAFPGQPASDAKAEQQAAPAAATAPPAGNAKTLQPITVSAPISAHLDVQKGNSKVLVLGTV